MTQSILVEASRLVTKDRQDDYGHPEDDFKRIATIWSTLLGDNLKEDLTPVHVASMMIALKLSRSAFKNKRDNWIDIAGYAHCADVCSTYTPPTYD